MVTFPLNKCNRDTVRLEKNRVVINEVINVKLPSSDLYYIYIKYKFTFRCTNDFELSIGSYSNLHVMNKFNRLH